MALRGTLTHRKTRRLANALGIDPPFAMGLLESLWHVAAEHHNDGGVGRMSNQDIADEMHYSGDAEKLVAAFIKSGWLDAVENTVERGRLFVHDWHLHADDSVNSKLIQWTKCYANGEPPRLRKLSGEARGRVVSKFVKRYGAFIGEKMLSVRTDAECAHNAHDAHIQKPEARSQNPEARIQNPDCSAPPQETKTEPAPVISFPPKIDLYELAVSTAEKMAAIHPWPGFLADAAIRLEALLKKSVNPETAASAFERDHIAWAAQFEIDKTAGRFIPNLAEYFAQGFYLRKPESRSRDSPRSRSDKFQPAANTNFTPPPIDPEEATRLIEETDRRLRDAGYNA